MNISSAHVSSRVDVRIKHRSEMEPALDKAVLALAGSARSLRQGILVTRCSPDLFTATVNRDVPYGTIVELSTW